MCFTIIKPIKLYILKSSGFLCFQSNSSPLFPCTGTKDTWFKSHPAVSKQWHPQPQFSHLQGPSPFYKESCAGDGGGLGKGCETQRLAWLAPALHLHKRTSPAFSPQLPELPVATAAHPTPSRLHSPGCFFQGIWHLLTYYVVNLLICSPYRYPHLVPNMSSKETKHLLCDPPHVPVLGLCWPRVLMNQLTDVNAGRMPGSRECICWLLTLMWSPRSYPQHQSWPWK